MKTFIACFSLFLFSIGVPFIANAQVEYSKECRKVATQQAKAKAKALKKEGWTYNGATTLEAALEQYNLKTGNCGQYEPKSVTVNNVRYITNGEKSGLKQAMTDVIKECNTVIAGKSSSESGINDDDDSRFENDKQYGQYFGKLNGAVEVAFSVTKKEPNGKYSVTSYILVNRDKKEKLAKQLSGAQAADSNRADEIEESVKTSLFE